MPREVLRAPENAYWELARHEIVPDRITYDTITLDKNNGSFLRYQAGIHGAPDKQYQVDYSCLTA
jgi:hypothetical protein